MMNCKRQWLMTGLFFLILSGTTRAETLNLVPARSSVEFAVSNMGVHKVHGRFSGLAGTIEYVPNAPTQSKVLIGIQAASIGTGIEKRDHHLRSKDFFNTDVFPHITYVNQSITPLGDHYEMVGYLTIKDLTKSVPVTFTFETIRQSNGKTLLKAKGHTRINREDFGLTYGNAFTIGHMVNIDLSIEAE